MRRGVLAGSEIFWPTRNEIVVLDSKTGSQTRPPISLSPIVGGANLVASRGRLIVAGFDKRGEERVRPGRLRLELRVKLNRQVPRMIRDFGDFDELAVW